MHAAPPTTSRRGPDWREQGACRDQDPELFFATDTTAAGRLNIEHAKAACRRCPSVEACLTFALNERIREGIYGGLTEQERANARRAAVRRHRPKKAATKPEQAPQPEPPQTPQAAYDDNTIALQGGHLGWTGAEKVRVRGRLLTPKQLAFFLDRGRMPHGPVKAKCRVSKCVLPQHLADSAERAQCGTRAGYLRHRARGEDACEPCKRANADADNRLRWTGTTKVAV